MKKLIFFTFVLFTNLALAQVPEWVNASYRSSNYSSSSYLVGFAEITDVDKKDIDTQLKDLEANTKAKLIESVKVDVKSVSTSNVSDFNGQISDYFNQKTTSQSNLQLIGLITESYYDKKNKKAYAFSYVNKMKMAEYYRSEIGKNITDVNNIITQGEILLSKGNIKSAYKDGLSAYSKFFQIDESQKILMAIGASNSLDTRIMEVNDLNNSFNEFMNNVITHRKMSMDDMGFIIANGLIKSQGDNHKNILLTPFTFEQTGLSSEFAYKLGESIKQSLPSEQTSTGYKITGNYYYEEDNLVVKSNLIDSKTGRVIGRNRVQIPELNLLQSNIVITPVDIENLKMLDHLQMESLTTGASGKAGLGLDKELVAKATKNGSPVSNIPVVFLNNNGGSIYCETVTDQDGFAKCQVKKISGDYKNQIIKAQLDLSRFLSNDTTGYVKNILQNKTIPSASFKVVVEPSTIYINTEENNFGTSLDVKLIEPKVKQGLSSYGFDFVGTEDNVDYVVTIRASSRKGGNVSGVYFAFVDVTISIFDVSLGKEIMKESINNVKGGGATFEQAGGKAYYAASDLVQEKVKEIMIK